jgi:CheY-like chemotaxis protein
VVSCELILVVEDDERIGISLSRAVEGAGYLTVWVTTGASALSGVATEQPRLVLLDLGLPDVDGLEVCRQLHRTHPDIDVIMLTARDDELDIVTGLDTGAVDYITSLRPSSSPASAPSSVEPTIHALRNGSWSATSSSMSTPTACSSTGPRLRCAPRSSTC